MNVKPMFLRFPTTKNKKNVCPTNFRISSILNHVYFMSIYR